MSQEKALLYRGSQPVLLPAASSRPRKQELLVFPVIRSLNGSLDQRVSCPRGLSVGSVSSCSPRDHEEVHGIKKMEVLGFSGCVLNSNVLALA